MILAFLLVVSVGQVNFGEEEPMIFRSAYRCWDYARIFQYGLRSSQDYIRKDTPVKTYCVPTWVTKDSKFQD